MSLRNIHYAFIFAQYHLFCVMSCAGAGVNAGAGLGAGAGASSVRVRNVLAQGLWIVVFFGFLFSFQLFSKTSKPDQTGNSN